MHHDSSDSSWAYVNLFTTALMTMCISTSRSRLETCKRLVSVLSRLVRPTPRSRSRSLLGLAIDVSCPSLPGYGSPSGVQLNNQVYSRYKHSLTFHIRHYVVSNETCAPIANPPNSAQLGAPQVTSGSVQYCGNAARDRQTDTQTDVTHTDTWNVINFL